MFPLVFVPHILIFLLVATSNFGLTELATAKDRQDLEKMSSFITELKTETARIRQAETVKPNTIKTPRLKM